MGQFVNVLMRCDGSPEIGLGHIVRCLALADELRDAHDCQITFAMRTGPLGIQMVQERGYQVITSRDTGKTFDYGKWLNECESFFTVEMLKYGFLGFHQFKPSFAHTMQDVAAYADAVDDIFEKVSRADLNKLLQTPPAHAGFHRLTKE